MSAILSVSVAAATTALTTLEAVKTDLAIVTADEDAFLEKAILRVTERVNNHVRVASASDGTATLGQETLIDTFRLTNSRSRLILSRVIPRNWPLSIVSVVENDVTLDSDEFEVESGGLLCRLSGSSRSCWSCGTTVVTYTAGWLLPNDTARNLPQEIEDAAIGLIKLARLDRTRDPTLRQENILDGLYSYQRFAPSDTPGGMPDDIAAALEPYRCRFIG